MQKKPLVLIADDSKSIVNIISVVLKARGIETVEAHNGNDAWKLLEERAPNVAVLDIVMPGKTGLELCSEIRSHPDLKDTRVLIMTSITKNSDLADGFWRIGTEANEFVTKPFDPFEIADKIERLLEKKGETRDNQTSVAKNEGGAGRVEDSDDGQY